MDYETSASFAWSTTERVFHGREQRAECFAAMASAFSVAAPLTNVHSLAEDLDERASHFSISECFQDNIVDLLSWEEACSARP